MAASWSARTACAWQSSSACCCRRWPAWSRARSRRRSTAIWSDPAGPAPPAGPLPGLLRHDADHGNIRVPAGTGLVQPVQILLPQSVLILPEPVEVVPAVQAAVVAIVEHQLERIVAGGLKAHQGNILLAGLQNRLTMALHLRRGRMHPQKLRRQAETGTVGILQFQRA